METAAHVKVFNGLSEIYSKAETLATNMIVGSRFENQANEVHKTCKEYAPWLFGAFQVYTALYHTVPLLAVYLSGVALGVCSSKLGKQLADISSIEIIKNSNDMAKYCYFAATVQSLFLSQFSSSLATGFVLGNYLGNHQLPSFNIAQFLDAPSTNS